MTHSRPLARSSRTFGFAQIPFAVSQTAQVPRRRRGRQNGSDDPDAGFGGDPIQGDVAANPTSTAGGGREWRAFNDGGRWKGEAGDEQEVFYPPRGEFACPP
jgi:hypothetical protein